MKEPPRSLHPIMCNSEIVELEKHSPKWDEQKHEKMRVGRERKVSGSGQTCLAAHIFSHQEWNAFSCVLCCSIQSSPLFNPSLCPSQLKFSSGAQSK